MYKGPRQVNDGAPMHEDAQDFDCFQVSLARLDIGAPAYAGRRYEQGRNPFAAGSRSRHRSAGSGRGLTIMIDERNAALSSCSNEAIAREASHSDEFEIGASLGRTVKR